MPTKYQKLKQLLEDRLGIYLYFGGAPRGLSLFTDLKRNSPIFRPGVVLDVGANVGETALLFRKRWPSSTIHAFEPVSETFTQLRQNTRGRRISCHEIALSETNGSAKINIMQNNALSSLESDVFSPSDKHKATQDVELCRLDDWLKERGIGSVSFLKIDTEGHDSHVLRGARDLIKDKRVDFIQIEAWITNHNRTFDTDALEFLYANDYNLISIIEQEAFPHKRLFFANFLFSR